MIMQYQYIKNFAQSHIALGQHIMPNLLYELFKNEQKNTPCKYKVWCIRALTPHIEEWIYNEEKRYVLFQKENHKRAFWEY